MTNSAPNRFIWVHIFQKAPTSEEHPPSDTPLRHASATAGAGAPFTSKNLPPPPLWKSFRRLWPWWYSPAQHLSIHFHYDIITVIGTLYTGFIPACYQKLVVVVLRSPIHANEPSEYNGMLYRTSNRVLNNGIKVIILICMDGTSQYHHHQ